MYKKLLAILMVIFSFSSFAKEKLKIGVTLQPYYSFAVNIVKDKADVIPVVRLDQYDSHSYQPKPDDIKRMNTLDVLIVNGIGHDEFIFDILNSADALTPYGVKIRYPQELNIKEYHVVKALSDMKTIYDFVTNKINELQALCNIGIE